MHSNWRDCKAWKDEKLIFSTTSNQACKLYDAALTQLIGWYEIDQLNGLGGTLNNMLAEDPNFIMGNVLDLGINLLNVPRLTNEIKTKLDFLNNLKETVTLERELLHIDAINKLASGNVPQATTCWERILIQNPTDMLAIKFAHDSYFYLGYHNQMRDSISRVLPLWKPTTPLYGYLYGLWSFGLVQTNFFDKAEFAAKKSLELNKFDAWSTHTICHLNEYRNTYNEGIQFLTETKQNWTKCNLLSGHNYWHLCLYYIEKGEIDAALQIYDDKILDRVKKSDAYLDIVDACSLLYRLKLIDSSNYVERWAELKTLLLKHVGDNGFLFNDMHIFMCISACNDTDAKLNFFKELNRYLNEDNENYLKSVKINLGVNIFQAINYFDQNEFAKCLEILYPIRYNLIQIGGSNAQRDLLHQMLTIAALKSHIEEHNKIGLVLLNERRGIKPDSNITKRIAARFATVHQFE
jgi:hypothetical protein